MNARSASAAAAGEPGVNYEQVQQAVVRGVHARGQDHGERPGQRVAGKDLYNAAPVVGGHPLTGPGRPGDDESTEHEEDRHGHQADHVAGVAEEGDQPRSRGTAPRDRSYLGSSGPRRGRRIPLPMATNRAPVSPGKSGRRLLGDFTSTRGGLADN